LFPPDDERLSLETCRGGKINTLKKKKGVKLVENPQLPQDARSTEYKILKRTCHILKALLICSLSFSAY
jgi:hypothetical protein